VIVLHKLVSAVNRKQLRPKKAKMSNNIEQLKSQTQMQSDFTVSRIFSDIIGFAASHTGRGDNSAAQSIRFSQSTDDNEPMEASQNTESSPTSGSDSDAVADLLKCDTENKKRIIQLESTVKQLYDQVAMLLARLLLVLLMLVLRRLLLRLCRFLPAIPSWGLHQEHPE